MLIYLASILHFVAFLFLTTIKKKVNYLLESRKIKEEYYQGDSSPRIYLHRFQL